MQGWLGRCMVTPLSKMGRPKGRAGGKSQGSHFGCAKLATPAWHPNGDVKWVIG